MDQPLRPERRRDSRFRGPVIEDVRVVLRPGQAVRLIDLSAGGAMVEGARPLRPGTRVYVNVTIGDRAHGLSARVLRCAIASLSADGVLYRGALGFDPRWDSLWEQTTRRGYQVPDVGRAARGRDGHQLPAAARAAGV